MTAQTISLSDLVEGKVSSIKEKQLAILVGHSASWCQKRRGRGLEPEFDRDQNGRIFYPASSVLKFLAMRTRHKGTYEYDNSQKQVSLELARAAKAEKSSTQM